MNNSSERNNFRNGRSELEDDLYTSAEDDVDYDALEQIVDDDDETIDDGPPSPLVRLIQSHDWAGTLARVSAHPSECNAVGAEGRTPLHAACDQDAPAVVIQALLKSYPEASLHTGTTNMNPLHITCSSKNASVHVIRVLIECGKLEQFSMRDLDGDTPLHTACRCGAPIDVLEVLLRAHYDAVHERDYEGLTPVQRLWVRYFVILGAEVIESVNCPADLSGELLDAWNKTELLLRCAHHGSLENTKPGAKIKFRAVHAAAAVDCPRAIIRIATKVYAYQLVERDEQGRTPLLVAAAAPVYKIRDLSDEGYALADVVYGENTSVSFRENPVENIVGNILSLDFSENTTAFANNSYPSVIEILIQANNLCPSGGACFPDPSGRLPLHIALSTGKKWNEGIKQLIEAYPDAVGIPDRSSKLYPFMIAASGTQSDLTATYELLRHHPSLIRDLCVKAHRPPSNIKQFKALNAERDNTLLEGTTQSPHYN